MQTSPLPKSSVLALALMCSMGLALRLQAAEANLFQDHGDIGITKHAGVVEFDPGRGAYTVAGGGANMWFTEDALHFAWVKVSGDVTLAAEIAFEGTGGDPHRKACLLIRQSLEPGAAYADAAIHGDGLTSLQYRAVKGERTYEIQAGVVGPKRLRIEKRGRYFSMSIQGKDGALTPAGGSFRLELTEPFYVGLGVCAHNNEALEKAVFSQVELTRGAPPAGGQPRLISTLETVPLASKDRRVVWTTGGLIEAPNWSRDGASLIFNREGRLYRLPVTGGEPQPIDTGFATRCNSNHGLSPDGATLAFSDQSQADRQPRIYTVPSGGGTPKLVTPAGPSSWHGWSPDGRTLAYRAERQGEIDIYTIPVEGGAETRLTTAPGLDEGPEFTADGQWIYFASDRSGGTQIWRMHADGSGQEQVTQDEFNNCFPHPSPDGKWLVFLSYDRSFPGLPENQDVTLRIRPLAGGDSETLAKLLGGKGTINVPSWSPDSKKVAFVSYQLIP